MRRAAVVAHPDDESLFAAGYILRNPGDWVIVCCSVPRRDPIRAEKFLRAAGILGAVPHLMLHVEPGHGEALPWLEELDLDRFDEVLTHNAAGEYGHSHHREVHKAVMRKARCPVIQFGHSVGGEEIHLTPEESGRKWNALRCYDHVLPYEGQPMPKWVALEKRYYRSGIYNPDADPYLS